MSNKEPSFSPSSAQRRVITRYSAPPWPAYNEAARLEDVSVNTARGWKKGPHGEDFRLVLEQSRAAALADYLVELDARLAGLGSKALEAVELALSCVDPKVQSQTARWTLEKILGKAKERHELSGPDGAPVVFTIQIDNANADRG